MYLLSSFAFSEEIKHSYCCYLDKFKSFIVVFMYLIYTNDNGLDLKMANFCINLLKIYS